MAATRGRKSAAASSPKATASPKKTKAESSLASPSKRQKTGKTDSYKSTFNNVVHEIDGFSTKIHKVLTHPVTNQARVTKKIMQKQDPKRAKLRQAIAGEIRRYSGLNDTAVSYFHDFAELSMDKQDAKFAASGSKNLKPAVIKAKVNAATIRKDAAAGIQHKLLVGEIKQLGPKVKGLLHHAKTPKKIDYSVMDKSRDLKQKHVAEIRSLGPKVTNQIQKRTRN